MALCACGDGGAPSTPTVDAGVVFDLGGGLDAGEPDDTGIVEDVGSGDAESDLGVEDTGEPDDLGPDLGLLDVGLLDVGSMEGDGGTTDAGPSDQGPYVLHSGKHSYTDLTPPCMERSPSPWPSSGGEWVVDTDLPFAIELMGRTYPAGSPISVSPYGGIVVGAHSATIAGSGTTLQPPVPGATVILAHSEYIDTRGGGYIIYSDSDSFRVMYCDSYTDTQRIASFELTLVAGANRVDMRYHSKSSGFSVAIGIFSDRGASMLGCSPQCDVDAWDVYSFVPAGRPQVGPDLRPVGVTHLSAMVPAGARMAVPHLQVENAGNVSSGADWEYMLYLVAPSTSPYGNGSPRQRVLYAFGEDVAPGGSVSLFQPENTMFAPATPGIYQFWATINGLTPEDTNPTNDLALVGTFQSTTMPVACTVDTASLPLGSVGQAYSASVTSNVCTAGNWTVSPSLPSGLYLLGSGAIGGTPSAASVGNFTFTVSQTGFGTASMTLPLVIR